MEEAETAATVAAVASELGKLFVGGISSETREDALEEHFGAYGEVKEAVVMRDRVTGNTRGFGFVQFADPEVAEEALKAGKHVIRGRGVEVKRAIPRGDQYQTNKPGSYSSPQDNTLYRSIPNHNNNRGTYNNGSSNSGGVHYNSRKIFVGGLPDSINEDEFINYFKKFGNVTDTVIMYDNMTHRPRGFGFVTFDSMEAVHNVLKKSHHELNGKMVEVKIAVPKDGNNSNNGINYDNSLQNSRSFNGRGNYFIGPQGMFYPPQRYGYMTNPYPCYGPYGHYPGTGYMMAGGYINGYGGMGNGVPIPGPRSPWMPRWNPVYNNTSNYWGMDPMASDHPWFANSDNNIATESVPDVGTTAIGSKSPSQAEAVALNAQ